MEIDLQNIEAFEAGDEGAETNSIFPWVLGAVLVAGGVGAYFLLKKPKEEDTSAEEYATANEQNTVPEIPETPEIFEYPHYAEVVKDGVNFRQQATTQSGLYMSNVPRGTAVTVLRRVNGEVFQNSPTWFAIKTAQGDRYAHSSLFGNFKKITPVRRLADSLLDYF